MPGGRGKICQSRHASDFAEVYSTFRPHEERCQMKPCVTGDVASGSGPVM